jgi:F-type H+-transporting ATPase subunit b
VNFNATLIGQSIAFLVFLWVCKQYVWPLFEVILEERKKRIADGLEAAARAEKDLEQAQRKVTERLKEAKTEAASIIDLANKRAAQIADEAKEKPERR